MEDMDNTTCAQTVATGDQDCKTSVSHHRAFPYMYEYDATESRQLCHCHCRCRSHLCAIPPPWHPRRMPFFFGKEIQRGQPCGPFLFRDGGFSFAAAVRVSPGLSVFPSGLLVKLRTEPLTKTRRVWYELAPTSLMSDTQASGVPPRLAFFFMSSLTSRRPGILVFPKHPKTYEYGRTGPFRRRHVIRNTHRL